MNIAAKIFLSQIRIRQKNASRVENPTLKSHAIGWSARLSTLKVFNWHKTKVRDIICILQIKRGSRMNIVPAGLSGTASL